jgi:DNA repair protein RadB
MVQQNKVSTGSYDLNKWLNGGYEKDVITTLYGGPGTGKSNLCLIAAVSQAKKGNKVIFIDTEGGFSIDRITQLVGKDEDVNEVLKNIIIMKPTNFHEQFVDFGKLLKEINKQKFDNKIGLIIIDSMTILYRLELADSKEDKEKVREINGVLARQMKILAEISRKKQIPIILTNQVYSEFLTAEQRQEGIVAGVRMVGGDILRYWSKCIIELQNNRGRRNAVLKKHRSLANKELHFEIINSGVRRKGLF